MKPKRVRIHCSDPMATDPRDEERWSDVWLTYKSRPGRVHNHMLTLIGRATLEDDLEFLHTFYAEHPHIEDDEGEVAFAEQTLARLEQDETVLDTKDGYTTIYSPAALLNRKEAERIIGLFLLQQGVRGARFDWKRPARVAT